jgi:hypothetical protein
MGAILLEFTSQAVTASFAENLPAAPDIERLAVDINVTAVSGTTPSMTLYVERQGADGNWYPIWTSSAITATGQTTTSVGPGCATTAVVTSILRFRAAITGTTPSFTMSASIIGRP